MPVGVIAVPEPPSSSYGTSEPVDVFIVQRVRPFSANMMIWRLLSISTWYPPPSAGTGRWATARRCWVAASAVPVMGRRSYFWNAMTAWTVSDPYSPSGVPSQ